MIREPLPATVDVYARGIGRLHWLCPACDHIHGSRGINWRSARLKCGAKIYRTAPRCDRTFRLGFSFVKGIDRLPPFNAVYVVLDRLTTNRIGIPDGTPAVARFAGTLEYRCPTCHTVNRQQLDPLGTVCCPTCGPWTIGVIFHRPTARTKRLTVPHDWILPATAADSPLI